VVLLACHLAVTAVAVLFAAPIAICAYRDPRRTEANTHWPFGNDGA
jgi:hypothetical protein